MEDLLSRLKPSDCYYSVFERSGTGAREENASKQKTPEPFTAKMNRLHIQIAEENPG
jgi:hypothetical protein